MIDLLLIKLENIVIFFMKSFFLTAFAIFNDIKNTNWIRTDNIKSTKVSCFFWFCTCYYFVIMIVECYNALYKFIWFTFIFYLFSFILRKKWSKNVSIMICSVVLKCFADPCIEHLESMFKINIEYYACFHRITIIDTFR
jgi:hypothetical protein